MSNPRNRIKSIVRRRVPQADLYSTRNRVVEWRVRDVAVSISRDTPLIESGSGDPGTSNDASASDHQHPAQSVPPLSDTTPQRNTADGAAGTSDMASRADHSHGAATGSGLTESQVDQRIDTKADELIRDFARDDHSDIAGRIDLANFIKGVSPYNSVGSEAERIDYQDLKNRPTIPTARTDAEIRSEIVSAVRAGANITITPSGTGDSQIITITTSGGAADEATYLGNLSAIPTTTGRTVGDVCIVQGEPYVLRAGTDAMNEISGLNSGAPSGYEGNTILQWDETTSNVRLYVPRAWRTSVPSTIIIEINDDTGLHSETQLDRATGDEAGNTRWAFHRDPSSPGIEENANAKHFWARVWTDFAKTQPLNFTRNENHWANLIDTSPPVELDGLSFWDGTLAQFNAITTKAENTIYYVED